MRGVLILACAGLSLWASPGGEYVGSNVCRACHPDVWLNSYKNPHYKSLTAGDLAVEKTGCEGCHGAGQAHVEARGGKTSIPNAFSLMPPGRILDTCLTCHSQDLSRANVKRSAHTLADVVCTGCHSIHQSPARRFLLARAEQREVCYGCHGNVRGQFSMPFKHRVNEGVVQCADCHNPHGSFAPTWRMSQRPRLVDPALGNETPCVRCHADKRGPFTFEHSPVRIEGCETCHAPHGAMNARLLRRPVVFTLCLECHNGTGNFGRQGDGIQLQSASHSMADPRYQQCTACHLRIHGSHSDSRFLR